LNLIQTLQNRLTYKIKIATIYKHIFTRISSNVEFLTYIYFDLDMKSRINHGKRCNTH